VVADVDAGPEFSVENAHVGARKGECAGIGEAFGKRRVEVIAHLGLELDFFESLKWDFQPSIG